MNLENKPVTQREIYAEGKKAALEGKDFFECPHTTPDSETRKFPAWLAGWCEGKKELTRK